MLFSAFSTSNVTFAASNIQQTVAFLQVQPNSKQIEIIIAPPVISGLAKMFSGMFFIFLLYGSPPEDVHFILLEQIFLIRSYIWKTFPIMVIHLHDPLRLKWGQTPIFLQENWSLSPCFLFFSLL